MIRIAIADKTNFFPDSLDNFDRFQVVTNVYRLLDGRLTLLRNPFTETWSPERRREKAAEILSGEYRSYCAFEDDRVVGELMLVPEPYEGRLIIDSFHVSRECRRKGVGRALFQTAAADARSCGAHALYISACSAEETIDFYLAMGCAPSKHPIPTYAEDEPCDIQMECPV